MQSLSLHAIVSNGELLRFTMRFHMDDLLNILTLRNSIRSGVFIPMVSIFSVQFRLETPFKKHPPFWLHSFRFHTIQDPPYFAWPVAIIRDALICTTTKESN